MTSLKYPAALFVAGFGLFELYNAFGEEGLDIAAAIFGMVFVVGGFAIARYA